MTESELCPPTRCSHQSDNDVWPGEVAEFARHKEGKDCSKQREQRKKAEKTVSIQNGLQKSESQGRDSVRVPTPTSQIPCGFESIPEPLRNE